MKFLRQADNYPSLHDAVRANDHKAVERLLKRGVSAGELDQRGAPPLHIAAAYGYLKVMHLLLSRGADVNYLVQEGGSALMAAAAGLQPEAISLLLSEGALPNLKGDGGIAPLMCVAQPNVLQEGVQAHCIRLLIESGSHVNERSWTGSTALMKAAWFGNREAAVEMLKKGADASLTDQQGRTAAMLAFEKGYDDLAFLLKV